jgi:hypothetical protein
MIERINDVLNAPDFCEKLDFGSFELKGILGFALETLDSMSSPTTHAYAQRCIIMVPTRDVVLRSLAEDMEFSIKAPYFTYRFSIDSFLDMLDGWTKLHLNFLSKAEVSGNV